jgi:dihydroorotate dehydrogenase (NAD+) catalytic subunit
VTWRDRVPGRRFGERAAGSRNARIGAVVGSVDESVQVGSVTIPNPVMPASGTAGYGVEFAPYGALDAVGAWVVKSLAPYPWPGNPAPRVHPTAAGMINAVGLQGPGVEAWRRDQLPALRATGARVVASIWGRSLEDYRLAAEQLAGADVMAVEVNLSCPNLEGRRGIFAHDPELSAAVIEATAACGLPRWAKLSANTDRVVEVAQAVTGAGAEAVTLINTLLGMVIDTDSGTAVLGAGGGGVSGIGIHPVAVRTVFDVRAALPEISIVGVGGVANGRDAAELILAGANAVQVGTASFADPRAVWRIRHELAHWAAARGLARIAQASGAAHRGGL